MMKRFSIKTVIALAVAFLSTLAIGGVAVTAKSQDKDNTRPGYGYGDKNHVHTGPPGQTKKP